jgi:hypothetical protein
VTQEEYIAAWTKAIKEQFKRLDTNHDGELSKTELAKSFGPGPGGGRSGFGGPPDGGDARP